LSNRISKWSGVMALSYRYTRGVAGERFRKELKRGRLYASKCPDCGRAYLPPRMYCERCLKELKDWVEVKGSPYVYSYSQAKGERGTVALVRFEGVEGGLLLRLREDYEELEMNIPLKLKFEGGIIRASIPKRQGHR